MEPLPLDGLPVMGLGGGNDKDSDTDSANEDEIKIEQNVISQSQKQDLILIGYMRDNGADDKIIKAVSGRIVNLCFEYLIIMDCWDNETNKDFIFTLSSDFNKNGMKQEWIEKNEDSEMLHYPLFGQDIVSVGDIKYWTFKIPQNLSANIKIGIIESDKINNCLNNYGQDFISFGYGLYTLKWEIFSKWNKVHPEKYKYAKEYEKKYQNEAENVIITMKLDMSSAIVPFGILSYYFNDYHNKLSESNVAYQDVDIDKGYKLAISMSGKIKMAMIDTHIPPQ